MVLCVCKCIFTLHAQKTQEKPDIKRAQAIDPQRNTSLNFSFWYFEFQKKRRAEGVIFCSTFEVFGAVISDFSEQWLGST